MQRGRTAAGWPGHCPVEVISKAQTRDELILRASLNELVALCRGRKNLNPAIVPIRWPAQPDIATLARLAGQAGSGRFGPTVGPGHSGWRAVHQRVEAQAARSELVG